MPTESTRPSPSARAALCGRQLICSAIFRIRSRVASLTPGRPFSANDTAPLDTPARFAMSAIVGLAMRPSCQPLGIQHLPCERSRATSSDRPLTRNHRAA